MKNIYLKSFFYAFLIIIFFQCCNNKEAVLKMKVSVLSLRKAALDTGRSLTLLQILKTYPAEEKCIGNKRYANLYICKRFLNGDTVCVFEECENVESFALDTSIHYAAFIDKKDFILQWPNELTVFVPPNFRIPNSANCFFAKLKFQTEY